jgi:LmbE family N-acetylglucosaminyl deacetylase
LIRYAELGHRVTVVYLTRGEAGIAGKSHGEAAAIRTAEAEAACKIMGAKPVFAGQIDGATEANAARIRRLLEARRPAIAWSPNQWQLGRTRPAAGRRD